MKVSVLFDAESRTATLRNCDRLQSLHRTIARYIPHFDGASTFLCSGVKNHASAQAIASFAVVFFSESLLSRAPEPIVQTVAIHEAIHLQLGSEIRDALAAQHPDVVQLLHASIIPEWLEGKVEMRSDDDYLLYGKGWTDLYGGWGGPSTVECPKAISAVNGYFALLKQGLVCVHNGMVDSIPPAAAERFGKSPLPLEAAYVDNPQEMVLKIVTGYELLEYLTNCLRTTLSYKMSVALWVLEEAFANYVSVGLTRTAFNELQKWAPQDRGKIELARRMQAASSSIDQVLERTRTYSDLVAFCREAGVVT